MDNALTRLEHYLNLANGTHNLGWQERLDRISDVVLSVNEEHYGVLPEPDELPAVRLDRLREVVLSRVADSLGVGLPDPKKPLRNRVRRLMTVTNRRMQEKPRSGGEYAKVLGERRGSWAARLNRELRRVMEFVSIKPDIADEPPTVDNFLDVVQRIEIEVFRKWRTFGPRQVLATVGEPLDLRDYYVTYQDDADDASEAAMLEQENRVIALLKSTEHLMTPLPE